MTPWGVSEKVYLLSTPRFEEVRARMDFRLTFEGILSSNASVTAIHDIRKQFHRQLKRLWEIHPLLKNRAAGMVGGTGEGDEVPYFDYVTRPYRGYGYEWMPLATKAKGVLVGLDILLLRPGFPRVKWKFSESGDVDNRVAILLDALQRPTQENELGEYQGKPAPKDEKPFFCLMENDGLVASLTIQTDTLLQPTKEEHRHDMNDARVVIAVKLKTYLDSSQFLPG